MIQTIKDLSKEFNIEFIESNSKKFLVYYNPLLGIEIDYNVNNNSFSLYSDEHGVSKRTYKKYVKNADTNEVRRFLKTHVKLSNFK